MTNHEPKHPRCFGSIEVRRPQSRAENGCDDCPHETECAKHPPADMAGLDGLIDEFDPIWDESVLLAEHEAVMASVAVGGWLSAALDDPKVCDAMKADIDRWFSSGFLYLHEVRRLMQIDREAATAESATQLQALAARVKVLEAEVAHYQWLLEGRDKFIVDNDLFMQFVDTLKGTEQ